MIDDLLAGPVGVPDPERLVGVPAEEAEVEPSVTRGRAAVEPEETKPIERRTEPFDVDLLGGHRRRRGERHEQT